MAHYTFTFCVFGKGSFPLDMLRYDGCFPQTSADAAKIEADYSGEAREIWLVRKTESTTGPTHERWESFGWRVKHATTMIKGW